MTRLSWGDAGSRLYETGADRGVLYPNSGPGVPWYGLISVSEEPTGGEPQPYYFDGLKYLNVSAVEEFAATIEAYSSPPEFAECDGTVALHKGLFASQQPRKSFGFSYRTLIGNDVDGTTYGYKIHLVYNAMAGPSSRSNQTLGDSVEPTTYSWPIEAVPFDLPGIKPTAHLIIDSTLTAPGLLSLLEGYLYGSGGIDPYLPPAVEVVRLFRNWEFDTPIRFLGQLSSSKAKVTNRVTNPSFEMTTNTIEVRRNHIQNPRGTTSGSLQGFALAAQWFGGTPNSGTTSWVAGATDGPEVAPGLRIDSYGRKTWTAVGSSSVGALSWALGSGSRAAVTAGSVWTASLYWRRSTGSPLMFNHIAAEFYDAASGGNKIGLTVNSQTHTTPEAGEWQRVSGKFTVPAGATHVIFIHVIQFSSAEGVTVGMTVDATGAMVEASPILEQYIDHQTSIQLRRNQFTDPRGISPLDSTLWRSRYGWAITNQTGITDHPEGITTAKRITAPVGVVQGGVGRGVDHGGNGDVIADSATTPLLATSGKTYTFSSWIRTSHIGRRIHLAVRFSNGADWLGPLIAGPVVTPSQGLWTRVSTTVVAPAGTKRMVFRTSIDRPLTGDNFEEGEYLEVSGVLLEESSTLNRYLDGNTPWAVWTGPVGLSQSAIFDTDMITSAVGLPNQSPSVLKALGLVGVSSGQPERAVRYASYQWAKKGNCSVKVVPRQSTGAHRESYAAIMMNSLVVGNTYTVLGTVRLESPQTGTLSTDPFAPPRGFWITEVAGSGVPNYISLAPNEAGEHEVRLTFVSSGLMSDIRLMNGALPGGGDVFWDNVMMVDGVYNGPYIDGEIVDGGLYKNQEVHSKWDGQPHNSTSSFEYYTELPEKANDGDAWLIDGYLWVYGTSWSNFGAISPM